MRELTELDLLRELEPIVAVNLDRHLAMAQEWFPHEWVPWSRGRDFTGENGLPWTPDQSRLPEAVRAAFEVNLLTEDNLPSYHHELALRLRRDGAWNFWVHRWTAEEAKHAMSIRDYLMLSRAVDPVALERDRIATMQRGWSVSRKGVLGSLVYVAFQELATRVAHRNTGRIADDLVADRLLTRIAADEHLHMLFYRDLIAAALELAPDQTVMAIAEEVGCFKMPGTSVPGFLRKSIQIADAGIYDVRLHRDEVIAPLLRYWRALEVPVTADAAKHSQGELTRQLDELEAVARRYEERRARRDAAKPV
jgi:acyl-[acyl-carrier-protein] desaturase